MLSVPPSTTHPPPTIPLHHIGMYRSHRYSVAIAYSNCWPYSRTGNESGAFPCEMVLWF